MTTSPRTHPMSLTALRAGRCLALAATGIALATALSACGSGNGSSTKREAGKSTGSTNGAGALAARGGTIDSCSLLTEAQLSGIIGTAVTVDGPAVDVARGRSCTYTFKETGNAILDEGTIDIAAWHGSEFFATGTIGASRSGIGEQAQDDSGHGIVIFRVGDDVVQVHVLSSDHKRDSVQIASAAANKVASATRLTLFRTQSARTPPASRPGIRALGRPPRAHASPRSRRSHRRDKAS